MDSRFKTNRKPNLKHFIKHMLRIESTCVLLFQEIKLDSTFKHNKRTDMIYEFEKKGPNQNYMDYGNYALVLIARGIQEDWKKPVTCQFSADITSPETLKDTIINAITELQEIGLNVIAVSCDQEDRNVAALSELCSGNNWFYLNEKKIQCIFDVTHLLKSTRNAFAQNDITFDGKTAKFDYLLKLMEYNDTVRYKIVPGLQHKHFNFEDLLVKTSVKVACRQLSHRFAAGIETLTLLPNNIVPPEAKQTCEFLSFMDQLFDSLNCTHLKNDEYIHYKPLKCVVRGNSPHMNFWSKSLVDIQNWRIIDKSGVDVTENFAFIKGWQITIKSMMEIWRELSNIGCTHLCTHRLNQGLFKYERYY